MTLASDSSLREYVDGWQPAVNIRDEILQPGAANALAATLDLRGGYEAGSQLPLLWQWAYFLDWPHTDELGDDGHPEFGHFLPPIPHRRRMFAGATVSVTEPLTLGERATKTSSIVAVTPKSGRTGELLFVTIRSDYRQAGRLRLVEEQNLVYRSDSNTGSAPQRTASTVGATAEPPAFERSSFERWTAEPRPTPATLFRFSAVTANAHRIHYDERYAKEIEGYPALVVHGPLLAVYMAELATSQSGKEVSRFTFRLTKPVFLGDLLRIEGRPDDADRSSADLRVSTGPTTVHATSRIEFK